MQKSLITDLFDEDGTDCMGTNVNMGYLARGRNVNEFIVILDLQGYKKHHKYKKFKFNVCISKI